MIYFQGAIVVFISIGVLVMTYQTTACPPPNICPECAETCYLDRFPREQWVRLPGSCFLNKTGIPEAVLSLQRRCPQP